MEISYEQIKLYAIICIFIILFIYGIISMYVIKNKGDKRELIVSIPAMLSLLILLFFSGAFVAFGLGVAFSVAFSNVPVVGAPKSFAILFGLLFAYFPLSIIISTLKAVIYSNFITCVKDYR